MACSDSDYAYLRGIVMAESANRIDPSRNALFDTRLAPIARMSGATSLEDFVHMLKSSKPTHLYRAVAEAMTINETSFFRDIAPFEMLRQFVLPELIAKRRERRRLRIWSAASSTGQEAYSVAMLVHEMKLESRPVEILGTDISENILERARQAKYVQFEVNRGLPAIYLVKYFERVGLDWRLKDGIRKMVTFRRFDLRQPVTPLGRFDIILCRNVLIYFDVETKVNILNQLWTALQPGGFLLLGGAETVLSVQDRFERIAVGTTAVYRKR